MEVANWLFVSKIYIAIYTFIESLNAREVTQVSMINLFWLNGMETEIIYQLHHSHHSGTEPAVAIVSNSFMPDTS